MLVLSIATGELVSTARYRLRSRGGGLVRQAAAEAQALREAGALLSAPAAPGLCLRLTFLRWLHLMEMPDSGC